MLRIVISDNGCGVPAVHIPRIKEKFYKANQTQRGSGIGLAVADRSRPSTPAPCRLTAEASARQ